MTPGPSTTCPCGTGATFDDCCGGIISGQTDAPTAESLMRSRYTAFVARDAAYLLRSWDPETRPGSMPLDSTARWVGLDIVETVSGDLLSATGIVEFRAHYERSGVSGVLHERSSFRRHKGRWVYVEGAAD